MKDGVLSSLYKEENKSKLVNIISADQARAREYETKEKFLERADWVCHNAICDAIDQMLF